ncbi:MULTISPECIES: hypothetical protein [Bosea]|uniref:hypothetical protein n=1 Tax=Bosea TaxID=85413 RepID=UPI0021500460|nr:MULTISPECIES: hypothetical protein [Bosea]MCR4521788.1 hypothetical protein [Bosea sp. 47.2.35]MDR6827311.1 hypothetical protein [Bosea robiniae]MDR6894021.1 hypothetical protein [Bosea sp. BE109]MDR7137416.1 hypothetical protein [Bosea sp. BE168]MDR7174116.1 hypothetical protein [Bosea sp. BE271]
MLKAAIAALFVMTVTSAIAQNYPRPVERGAHCKCARMLFGIQSVNGYCHWSDRLSNEINACAAQQRRVVRQERVAPNPAQARGAGSVPYRIGLGLAAQRGVYGASGGCFARVFEASASQRRSPDHRIRYGISGRDMPAFARELQRRCGILFSRQHETSKAAT